MAAPPGVWARLMADNQQPGVIAFARFAFPALAARAWGAGLGGGVPRALLQLAGNACLSSAAARAPRRRLKYKKPPEGWELIEEVIEDFEQQVRGGRAGGIARALRAAVSSGAAPARAVARPPAQLL